MDAAPVVLTIAGSDPSGGAGIQADLKTFATLGAFGAAVVTAITAQNTWEVRGVEVVSPAFVVEQLDAVLDDLDVRAIKTGMLGRVAVVEAVAHRLAAGPAVPIVLDPVLVSTAGQPLTEADAVATIRRDLLPLATLVTPNLPEAEALTGRPVSTPAGMRDAARALTDLGARAVLVKGGHLPDAAVDVLWDGTRFHELAAPRVPGVFHGTGCTLSAAIAVHLARGTRLRDAVAKAKRYVTDAIADSPPRGRGARPLDNRSRG
jgi:hydroxymethylpyrimidine/phosphomethylpyrimidine kinase